MRLAEKVLFVWPSTFPDLSWIENGLCGPCALNSIPDVFPHVKARETVLLIVDIVVTAIEGLVVVLAVDSVLSPQVGISQYSHRLFLSIV